MFLLYRSLDNFSNTSFVMTPVPAPPIIAGPSSAPESVPLMTSSPAGAPGSSSSSSSSTSSTSSTSYPQDGPRTRIRTLYRKKWDPIKDPEPGTSKAPDYGPDRPFVPPLAKRCNRL